MEETKELITTDDIRSKVYIIRGQQVMLDKDLAELYGYEVKRLNEQVKRNISRFPEDFMFQLNKEEIPEKFSKSQIATLNEKSNRQGSNIKKMPFAFTEQGIYMLATVLRGELAEQQSIFIMRTFREMRHYIKQNQQFVTRSEMEVSHAQPRHLKMKKQPDFFKIYDPQDLSRLIAVVNLNYMFPIPKNEVTPFAKKDIGTYRTFKSEEEKSKYIDLLDSEMKMINRMCDLT